MKVRLPAVSGSFYPALANELEFQIDSFFHSLSNDTHSGSPKMLIVPHAGYVYSGQVAAQAFALLAPYKHRYKRVVLLGPSHRVPLSGIALPEADQFETPLGNVVVDATSRQALESLSFVSTRRDAHELEHSLEVQIPFLQKVLDSFEIIPLVVGKTDTAQVSDVLSRLWGTEETLIVISTDLSHFLFYNDAKRVDSETIDKIRAFQSDLRGEEACGHYPLNGALAFAQTKGLRIDTVASCNSGDVSGSKENVVGYASFALFSEGVLS